MRITNTPGVGQTTSTKRVKKTEGAKAYGKAPSARTIHDTVQVHGIPKEELTERVHAAIISLMDEVDTLRRELERTNKRLREVEDLADTDVLVPIHNRRAFVAALTRMISFAERYSSPSTLMYIDMNDMKAINDKYGHDSGDKALQHLTSLLVSHTRSTDEVGRIGGDEFGILLAQTDEEKGASKAAALAKVISDNPLTLDGDKVTLRVAYGTYTFKAGDQAESALKEADKQMYAHKRAIKGDDNVR